MYRLNRLFMSRYSFFFILAIGLCLRIYGLNKWSLWEDEEATLFYSHNQDMSFPRFFPLFFRLLHWVFTITGESAAWGRFPAAVFGIAGIWMTYVCVKKFFSKDAALLASFLLAVNMGHLFWSQSIRYYSGVYLFLLVSIYFFLDGFENDRRISLIWSSLFLFLATLTHSSAILIVPVYLAYLFYMGIIKDKTAGYRPVNYMVYGFLLICGLGFFIYKSLTVHQTMSAIVIPSAMDPVHIVITFFAYFGFPVVILGFAAIFKKIISKNLTPPFVFFAILSVLPILEIIVISRDTSVTWYHGFIALNGFVVISSVYITALIGNGFHKTGTAVLIVSVCYYVCFLGFYYTSSYGNRPRWEEACAFVQTKANIDVHAQGNPDIFATAPGVVAYYLGIPGGQTMEHPLVKRLGFNPPRDAMEKETWFLIKSNYINAAYVKWLEKNCILETRIVSKIGPFDRWTILIYRNRNTF